MITPRLEIRLPAERDRACFVDMFCDEEFMIFSAGVHDATSADARFDAMLAQAAEIPSAKQPAIGRTDGEIIGYTGVSRFEFEGQSRLEYGYRLVPHARGHGFATEAAEAVLTEAASSFDGEILAFIDPTNQTSKRVALKLGFVFWKAAQGSYQFMLAHHRCQFFHHSPLRNQNQY